jgi:hypothetical protein
MHRLAGLGVAADACRSAMQRKAAEATNLHAFLAGQGIADLIQDQLHRQFHVLLHQMRLLERQLLDQLGLGHGRTLKRLISR